MALSDSNKRTFQRWAGRIDSDIHDLSEDDVDALVLALGSAKAAALQVLSERLGDFESLTADISSDVDGHRHEANIAALRKKIAQLVAAILESDDNLTTEGQDLVDEATGGTLEATTSIDVIARRPRRG